MYLVNDILTYIYSFINYADDAYNLRLVNNEWAFSGLQFIAKNNNYIHLRSTFISCSCHVCGSPIYKQYSIFYDLHPQRIIHFCNKWKCHSIILSNLLRIYHNDNVYPWIRWYPSKNIFPILRSSGFYSKGTPYSNIVFI